jgi:ferredoxin
VPPHLIRPPGAGDEKTFLNLCIRCGECMKVCPTNVLQPTIFQSGLEGVFSPRMDFRFIFEQSFCEYTCTLCGQVCPTGAIPRLTEEAKHARPSGKAYFNHNLCLPWAEKTPCIRCEEMCPAPEKAIKILNTFTIKGPDGLDVEIQQPQVDRDLCVGCGICESNCTIEGESAIRVQRVDLPDPGTEFLLKPKAVEAAKKAEG